MGKKKKKKQKVPKTVTGPDGVKRESQQHYFGLTK